MKILDTNFLVDFIDKRKKAVDMMNQISNEILVVSEASIIELYAGARNARIPDEEFRKIEDMLTHLNVIEVNENVREKTTEVYAYLKKIRKMIDKYDITIAGTALTLNATLVTDDSDFDRIEQRFGLKKARWR